MTKKPMEQLINLMVGACIGVYGFGEGRQVAETIIRGIMDDLTNKAESFSPGEEFSEEYMTEDRKLRLEITAVMEDCGDGVLCVPKKLVANGEEHIL